MTIQTLSLVGSRRAGFYNRQLAPAAAKHAPHDIKQLIFGVADGLTSALGVVIPLALSHRPMLAVVFGLAICASIGMGGGEFLSDKRGNWRSSAAMAIATFVGSVIPALPFLVLPEGMAAAGVSCGLCAATLVGISETKAREMSRRQAYLQTFSVLVVASLATIVFAVATGTAA